MAQHLRVGSVIDYGGNLGAPQYGSALVTNITGSYIEFEWTDPSTSAPYVLVRPWNPSAMISVVDD